MSVIKLFKYKCASDFDWLVELENEGLIKLNFPAELYSKKAYLLFSLECERSELDDNKFRFEQSKESIKECPEKIKENRNKMNKLNKELNKIIKELEEGSAKTKGFLESPRKKLGDVEK